MVEIIPGINETDPLEIDQKIRRVQDFSPTVQIDFQDATLTNTVNYFELPFFNNFRHLFLEAHLMVADPAKYVPGLAKSGFRRILAQVEGENIREYLDLVRTYEIQAGLALDAASPLELVEPFLDSIDFVQVMSVNMGLSGQVFQSQQLEKIRRLHENYPDLVISVDGGINPRTATLAVESGAGRLVVTSFLFGQSAQSAYEKLVQTIV